MNARFGIHLANLALSATTDKLDFRSLLEDGSDRRFLGRRIRRELRSACLLRHMWRWGSRFFVPLLRLSCSASPRPTWPRWRSKAIDRGTLLKQAKANIDRPLAAILSLNTVAHTVGAIGVGAEAALLWGSVGVGIASGVMTLAILIASEIIPKTIGATYWRTLAPSTVYGLTILVRVFAPLVWLSEYITRAIGGDRGLRW